MRFSVGGSAKMAPREVVFAILFAILVSSCMVEGQAARAKVIVDTDVGIDDAFALGMLLAADQRQEIEIVAITTVLGNTGVRNVSRNVLKILQTANRLDIPVYEGAAFSLELTNNNDSYFGYDGFGDIEYPNPPGDEFLQPVPAVLGLLELTKTHLGEINLLLLGPLTNYALAIRTVPEYAARLASVWVLGGSMIGKGNMQPGVEFNFWVDPLAAFITFSPPVHPPNLVQLVPLEMTMEAATTIDWRINVLGALPGKVMALLNAAEEQFWPRSDMWVCSDLVLAAAFLQRSTLVLKTRPSFIGVEVHGLHLAGATFVDYNEPGNEPNVEAIQVVDAEAFKTVVLDYFGGLNFCNNFATDGIFCHAK
ncbi:uncharacterized protein LOC132195527 [Neocloeon triangulifer]|uniref:uncharacterized protein LOC132195527 n=1 Tax=Neocloeon triangulifer TaxID=2078957 RepID=UPI00286F18B3|nr:uncharacterized protein LOC132195527 [Neocloeon triangulifer]